MKDYYYILGIGNNATSEEIKNAYRKLTKKFHPDLNPSDSHFDKMFRDVQEAYECLSDDSKRRNYDKAYASWSNDKGQAHFTQEEADYPSKSNDKEFTAATIIAFAILGYFLSQMLIEKGSSDEKYSLLIGVAGAVAVNAFLAPFLVATWKRHTYKWAILAGNLILGWTGLGWIACFLFSIYADKK